MNYLAALRCASSSIVLLALGAGVAHAQTPEGDQPASELGEVVVTGSRIARDGYDAPTPVTVTSAEQLQLASPTTISSALNMLPQFKGSSTPQTGGVSANGAAGAAFLNLRGLGSQRNLVLLDGRRVVASAVSGTTDVNLLPQELVQRVEVVTGGASAAYGSDAVAGVVNFILDTKFTGLKGQVQGGISDYGDAESFKANLSYGAQLGDRAHLLLSGEYYRSQGIAPYHTNGRDWAAAGWSVLNNPEGQGTPRRFLVQNICLSGGSFGGLITTTALRGTEFGPGATPQPFQFGQLVGPTHMVGGNPCDRQENNLTAGVERWTTFGRVDFDVTDTINVFVEGTFSQANSVYDQFYNNAITGSAPTIFRDNAFLPEATRAEMVRLNVQSFRLGRYLTEAPFIRADNFNETWRIALGAKGEFGGGWTWDAYYTRGEGNTRVENQNVLIHRNFHAAVDAVRDPAGNIVCRSTLLTGADPGCVPFNIFGEGSPSAAAVDYVIGDSFRDLTLTQDVAAAAVQGKLFSLWSDPIGVAFGVEYRKETAEQFVDPISQSIVSGTGIRGFPAGLVGQRGGFYVSNPQPIAGEFDVTEGFVEIAAPIARDMPGIHTLELNGAARLTNYSTSGQVTTWKIGASYEPFDGLRLRATRSRDIRAPNIAELFTGSTQSTGQLREPATGATVQFVGNTTGNPELDPEIADTLTLGVVYQPQWFSGFSASVDYYDIEIAGAIASLGAQATLDECARGSQVACSNIDLVAGIYRVRLPQLNLQSLITSGFDLEASYRTDVFDGILTLRALANYTKEFVTTTPGAPPIDRAGEVGQADSPHWQATFSANFARGPFNLYLQQRYIDGGTYNNTFVQGVDIDDNQVEEVWYTDVTARYQFEVQERQLEAFLTINNLFNRDPPIAPAVSGSTARATNFSLYDALGRYYTAGIRFRF